MADDYEILDPTKADLKFDSDGAPDTPMLSSKQLSVSGAASSTVADKKIGEQGRKVILRKKDAEKIDDERSDGSRLSDLIR
ncbi:hypothetical protein X798_05454 [Onchocerca flexuosa]|uniref:Uncharacterized protein n=1 Tax=Onchocerca flexuosa TaxID=387005 RepID=A0A238BRA5_9BILA|nr:hypothetical protein X798_05454 [Onchocerca flexuosa]